MKIYAETERLVLRAFVEEDAISFFEMDSDPLVHIYLGNNPITTIEQAASTIANIRKQYVDFGIGRWAVIEKCSGAFIGWSGLKFIDYKDNEHINFHDVGYRLMPKYWGKGYATESAKVSIKYGFEAMNLEEIIGTNHVDNLASRKALEKCGLKFVETFDWKGNQCNWFKITKSEYEDEHNK
ncbi:MAG: GNAT family N-acetyltransferase [Saprospiraceae bacterium]